MAPEAVWQVWRRHTNLNFGMAPPYQSKMAERSQDPQSAREGMKFGKLILRKVTEIVDTRCQILRLKCSKIDLQRSPDPLAGIKGSYF